jgi:signal peptidase I
MFGNVKSLLIKLTNLTLVAVIIVGLVHRWRGIDTWKISGESMSPTLEDGDYSISLSGTDIERGDIVCILSPLKDGKSWIKRVIGIPGDAIVISGNYITVNGEPDLISQKYSFHNTNIKKGTTLVLLEGEYFVAGDNRSVSYDSRYVGPIKHKTIIGEQLFAF